MSDVSVKLSDGTIGSLPADQADNAIRQGLATQASPEEASDHVTQQAAAKTQQGPLSTFMALQSGGLRGVAGAFGAPLDAIEQHAVYDIAGPSAASKLRSFRQGEQAEHPYASGIGEMAGYALPALVGADEGIVAKSGQLAEDAAKKVLPAALTGGESLGARVATKVATGAARGVVEGAQMGVTDAINEDAIENKPLMGEQVFAAALRGGAGGALLGGALSGAGEVASSAKSSLADVLRSGNADVGIAGHMSNAAEDQAARSLFHTSDRATIRKMDALPGGIRGVGRQLLDDGVIASGDGIETIAPKVEAKLDALNAHRASLLESADNAGAEGVSAAAVVKDLRERFVSKFEQAPSLYGSEQRMLDGLTADIASAGAKSGDERLTLGFTQAQRLRRTIDQKIKDFAPMPGAPANTMQDLLKAARGTLEDHLEAAMDKAEPALGQAAGAEYRAVKIQQRRYILASTALEKATQAMNSNQAIGLGSKVVTAGAMGHFGAGGLLVGAAHHYGQRYGNASAAVWLDKISKMRAFQRESELVGEQMNRGVKGFFKGAPADATPPKVTSEVVEGVRAMASDPQQMQRAVQKQIGNTAHHSPQLATQMAMAHSRAMSYLGSQLPRALAPANAAQPQLQKKQQYSASDLHKFAATYQTVTDPGSTMKLLGTGKLTKAHVDAMRAVYPAMYKEFTDAIVARAHSSTKPMTYTQRLELSLLLGQPIDATVDPAFVASVQAAYAEAPSPASPGAKAPMRPLKLSSLSDSSDNPESIGEKE